MPTAVPHPPRGPIAAIVVSYESSAVLERCLTALARSAPRRGVQPIVVDNASSDGSADLAERILGPGGVIRLNGNRGFAAGVNAGFAATDAHWLAVVNPDVEVPPGGLDALVDELERHPRAALAGPLTVDAEGVPERTVGHFPSPAREWAHSWLLDHVGWPGRFAPLPATTRPVDWVSGCCWVLRGDAVREVGPLDESYFMYFEDVDYCRRLHDAGRDVLFVPSVRWMHGRGRGSRVTAALPADGGRAALRYFHKFHPSLPQARASAWLLRGWRLRMRWRLLRARLGDARSAEVARRYAVAINQVRAR